MHDELIQRGGCAGAAIATTVTFVVLLAVAFSADRPRFVSDMVSGGLCLLFFTMTLGYFAGLEGARSKSTRDAFLKGAFFFSCALVVFAVLFFWLTALGTLTIHHFLISLAFSVLLISTGALVSGMAAIVVRDYRDRKRWRLIPQFTLQELMIVITLAAAGSAARRRLAGPCASAPPTPRA